MKSKSVSFLRDHYLFFRFLRAHPKLNPLCFEEWVSIAGTEWEFCSVSHSIIIELSDKIPCPGKMPAAPFKVLRYEIVMWHEFPEIVAEDIAALSAYSLQR